MATSAIHLAVAAAAATAAAAAVAAAACANAKRAPFARLVDSNGKDARGADAAAASCEPIACVARRAFRARACRHAPDWRRIDSFVVIVEHESAAFAACAIRNECKLRVADIRALMRALRLTARVPQRRRRQSAAHSLPDRHNNLRLFALFIAAISAVCEREQRRRHFRVHRCVNFYERSRRGERARR